MDYTTNITTTTTKTTNITSTTTTSTVDQSNLKALINDPENALAISEVVTKFSTEIKRIGARRFWRNFDPHGQKTISTEAFKSALQNPNLGFGFSEDTIVRVVKICDASTVDGKISYEQLYTVIGKQDLKHRHKNSTLKQVIIVCRHGSRFPLHILPNDQAWPINDDFWKSYGGLLTPVGNSQHVQNGEILARTYMEKLHLLPDDPKFPDYLNVLSSNSQRTIWSAMSLLNGFAPTVPKSFDMETNEITNPRVYQGIKINMAEKKEILFHGNKNNKTLKKLSHAALTKSEYFKNAVTEKKKTDLLDALHKATALPELDPDVEIMKRFSHMTAVDEHVEVEDALNMNVLTNPIRTFSDDEIELIREISNKTKQIKFCGNSMEEQLEISRMATGLLPKAIIDVLDARISQTDQQLGKKKFVLFSAHDDTVMPLLAFFGFSNYQVPQFAAMIVIELHNLAKKFKDTSDQKEGNWVVNFRYINKPLETNVEQYRTYQIPFGGKAIPMEDADEGPMNYFEFRKEIMDVRKPFTSFEDWNQFANPIQQ